jgi:transmembrane sensor
MSDELRLQLLFAKYLQRSCTPQEVEELFGLLNQAANHRHLDEAMLDVWEQLKKDNPEYPVNWDAMYASITTTPDLEIPRVKRFIWMRYAAAAAVIGGLVVSVYLFTNRTPAKPIPVISDNKTISNTPNPTNSRQTIHLPDGSTAILNAGSKLNYPSAFTHDRRDVYLSGEGFFDIYHDTRRPFFVHIGKLYIKVLGTAFNIKAYPADERIEVTVTRGKVQVFKENQPVIVLKASQQFSFSNITEAIVTKLVDTIPVVAWKPAEIYFNDITMGEAARQMEQRFGLVIEFTDPSARTCKVTATFSEDDLAEEMLTVLCAITKTEYTITNKKVTINGKGSD